MYHGHSILYTVNTERCLMGIQLYATWQEAFFSVLVQIVDDKIEEVPNHLTHSEFDTTVSSMNIKLSLVEDSEND